VTFDQPGPPPYSGPPQYSGPPAYPLPPTYPVPAAYPVPPTYPTSGPYPYLPNNGYPAWPMVAPRISSLAGLAVALRVLLILSALVDVVAAFGWWHEYALVDDLQTDPYSVTAQSVNSADNLVNAASAVSLLLFLACGVVFLVWFYRARQNAEVFGGTPQRRSQGWAIGGWFCPIVNLLFPYQMTVDILSASEPSDAVGYRAARSYPLLRSWWAAWLGASVLGGLSRFNNDRQSLDDFQSHAIVSLLTSLFEVLAAVLAILVIARITKAQQARLRPGG
jgi:hypothetical protein